MPQKKGQTGNPNGRPVGSKNERTKQWEALGDAIRSKHADRFNAILDELPPEKFVDVFLRAMEYFEPKLARTETKVEGDLGIHTTVEFRGDIDDLKTDEG